MGSNKFTNSSLFAYFSFLFVCVFCCGNRKIEGGSQRRLEMKLTVKFALHCFHFTEIEREIEREVKIKIERYVDREIERDIERSWKERYRKKLEREI